jgi:hypothetical protein
MMGRQTGDQRRGPSAATDQSNCDMNVEQGEGRQSSFIIPYSGKSPGYLQKKSRAAGARLQACHPICG